MYKVPAVPSAGARCKLRRWFENPSAGFRFSMSDGVVIACGGSATWLLWPLLGTYAVLIPFVLGHFFLFCNVFRIRRNFELLWAALFMLNFTTWFLSDSLGRGIIFSWWLVLAIQTPISIILIAAEMRSARYHGIEIFRQKI